MKLSVYAFRKSIVNIEINHIFIMKNDVTALIPETNSFVYKFSNFILTQLS